MIRRSFRISKKTTILRSLLFATYFILIAVFVYVGFQPKATNAESSDILSIPSISLTTNTEEVKPINKKLPTPDSIAGIYRSANNKIFIIGHSTTVFKDLTRIQLGDEIKLSDKIYKVTNISTKAKESIDMNDILKSESEPTIILMTCYGKPLGNNDFSDRLIIKAKEVMV